MLNSWRIVSVFLCLSLFISQQIKAQGMSEINNPVRYDRVKKIINEINLKYPNQTNLINLGISDSGDQILGLQIGTGKTHHLVVATHHGNEYGSTEVALALAGYVAEHPLAELTLFIIPVLNIGGYNANIRMEKGADGANHDPNRDYPGPCGTEGPYKLKSTKALAQFIELNKIVGATTLHTFSPAILYPWGMDLANQSTHYNDSYINLSQIAARLSHYQVGNSAELLYPCNGAFEDFVFWKFGIWSFLFELGTSHSPNPNDVQQLIDENVPGLYELIQAIPKTIAPDHEILSSCRGRNLRFIDRHDE